MEKHFPTNTTIRDNENVFLHVFNDRSHQNDVSSVYCIRYVRKLRPNCKKHVICTCALA